MVRRASVNWGVDALSMSVLLGVLERFSVAVGGGISSEVGRFGVGASKCGVRPVSGSAVRGVILHVFARHI